MDISEQSAEIVAKYTAAINAYNALASEENWKYVEEVYQEYKDFITRNIP
jgi:hypothetical protein